MKEIRVYFEGDGTLRGGFEKFFSETVELARTHRVDLRFIAARDGPAAYEKAFRSDSEALNILLKDSEEPLPRDVRVLCRRHGISPSRAKNVFWMVQLMESWFLADPVAVERYFNDQKFSRRALKSTTDVEKIQKTEVNRRLRRATFRTKKGAYHKTKHAPHLLERLDPKLVKERAENCRKFFIAIQAMIENQ
ncbi:MAG TPA: DUF4276 family protein [Bryobacteraceae bacterium]|nr:DUF4276 family protein [Bryobacteraceae bacterium]